MNPVMLGMDGLLAVLLLVAVAVGLRLNVKLKGLRESQAGFVKAVGELDKAAGRAEAGLASLRAATQEAHDQLLARIDTARELSTRMERAVTEASSTAQRLEGAVQGADGAARRAHALRPTAPTTDPSAEPIPFPRLRAPSASPTEPLATPGLRAALAAAERIVDAEVEPLTLARPARPPAAASGGDRLSRFVARRQGGRA